MLHICLNLKNTSHFCSMFSLSFHQTSTVQLLAGWKKCICNNDGYSTPLTLPALGRTCLPLFYFSQ